MHRGARRRRRFPPCLLLAPSALRLPPPLLSLRNELLTEFIVRAPRLAVEDLATGSMLLTGEPAHYLTRVRRLAARDEFFVFDPESGTCGEARVLRVGHDQLEAVVLNVRESGYRPLPVALLQGLGKGDKPDKVIRDATALGVASIVLVESTRSVVNVPVAKRARRVARWRNVARSACAQCERGRAPSIAGPVPLEQALSEAACDQRLVLAPVGRPLLETLGPVSPRASVALLVGPEGGISADELAMAEKRDFCAVSLGANILRTELAGIAALGALVARADAALNDDGEEER